MKILVVDDEIVSRKKMQKIMASFGDCETVETGKEALSSFSRAWEMGIPFDMISLDIAMPDMDGIQVLKHIRLMEKEKEIPKPKQVKIMMVTSHTDKDTVVESMKSGCNNYIVKPFDKDRVAQKLQSLGFNIS